MEQAERIRILPMTREDAAGAAGVERICFAEPWSEASYRATLLLPYAHYFKAVEGERMVGTIGLQVIGGDGEISNVAVLPQYRRRGIAHRLMEEVLLAGESLVTGDYTLEVREGNTAARALYDSFGFVTEGVRKNYYSKPCEDALIMWRRRAQQETKSSTGRYRID